jgi:hypothetical protein
MVSKIDAERYQIVESREFMASSRRLAEQIRRAQAISTMIAASRTPLPVAAMPPR